jgi:hypothetical protein
MDIKERGWEGVDWIHLAQVKDVMSSCENDNASSGSIKDGEFFTS